MRILYVLISLFIGTEIVGQQIAIEFPLQKARSADGGYEQVIDLSEYIFEDFIAVSVRIEGRNIGHDNVKIRVETRDSVYLPGHFCENKEDNAYISELLYLPVSAAGELLFSFGFADHIEISSIEGMIRVFSPAGQKKELPPAKKKRIVFRDYSDCNCPQPDYIDRTEWGSVFGLTDDIFIPPPAYTDITHLIIHHSAGPNSSSNWPGVVAAIFDFHVNTNKWQDIGYNWLIDPNGILYEGRGGGDNVRGAHMCGFNNNTMGLCILGTYSAVAPNSRSIDMLLQLAAWKSCKQAINPEGFGLINSYPGSMFNISGHKDGCAPGYTECPGAVLHSMLDSIRISVAEVIDQECAGSNIHLDQKEHGSFDLYPNPARDYVVLDSKLDILDAEVLDMRSKKMISIQNNFQKITLDLSKIESGIYIVRIVTHVGIFHRKLVRF